MSSTLWDLGYEVVSAMRAMDEARDKANAARVRLDVAVRKFATRVPKGLAVSVGTHVVVATGTPGSGPQVTVVREAHEKDLLPAAPTPEDVEAASVEDAQRQECANGEPHAPLGVPEPDAKSWVPPDHSTD